MAEELDPFEAAMSAMNGDNKEGEGLELDELEAALKEDAATSGGDDAAAAGTPSTDPFEAAKEALEGDAGGGEATGTPSTDPFEAAMAAMDAVSSDDISVDQPPETSLKSSDPFESALAVTKKESTAPAKKPKDVQFEGQEIDIDFLMDIKMTITFEVGRTKMFISDLLSLGQGSVIELHRLVGEELDMFINGELMATGEVVVVNEKFGG